MLGIRNSLSATLRRAQTSALLILTLCPAIGTKLFSEQPPINSQLLAEFSIKVARYVTWPEEKRLYQIHAVGFTEEQKLAFKALNDRKLKENPIAVTFDNEIQVTASDLPEIIVLGKSQNVDPSQWCFSTEPILVIVHSDRTRTNIKFCESSIISVYSNRGRAEFDVNLSQAEKTGLKLSARMLRLAKNID